MIYRQWASGRAPHYRPTIADLAALAGSLGEAEPMQIHNYPVAMHVMRMK